MSNRQKTHTLACKKNQGLKVEKGKTSTFRLLFLAVFLIPSAVFSQNPQSLDSIVIQTQGLQIPFSKQNRNITVIDQTVIKAMPVKSVDDLLSYVAGLDIQKRGVMGAQADVSINGGTFDQTLILLNGMKVIDPQTGHNMMNLPITLDAIKRIEVLKGPAASAYGVNAINGAINIVTRQPDKSGVKVDAFGGSSFDRDTTNNRLYTGIGLNAGASFATENSSHLLSVGTVQSNGYRHNTAINTNKVFYSNRLKLGNTSLKMMGGYVSNDFGANGFYAAPNDPEAKETVKTLIGGIEGSIKLTDFWTLKPGLSYRYGSDDFILDKHQPEIYRNKHYTNVFDATLKNIFYSGIGTFGFGVEFKNDEISSNSLGDHSKNDLGFFGNYHFDKIPKTSINLGVYANYNTDYGWDWMPSLDIGYDLAEHWRIYANTGTGLRLPTYTDLYYTGPVNIGNEDIKPEKSWQTAAGIKYRQHKLNASVNYFYRNTRDFIDWVKDDVDDPWQSQNYQRIKMQGISFSADYRMFPEETASSVSLLTGISYTYLSPKVEKYATEQVSHYALENLKHQLTGRATMRFLHRFGLTLTGKYQKRITGKDYVLLAARLSAEVDDFTLYLDGDNLTNIQYTETSAVPMPGRWFNLGVKWTWWN